MEKLRIVFMGTPEFAVGILDTIHKANHEIVGVVTVADKPAGRGQKVKYSAVKEYALENSTVTQNHVTIEHQYDFAKREMVEKKIFDDESSE